jgi:hypothetical protein
LYGDSPGNDGLEIKPEAKGGPEGRFLDKIANLIRDDDERLGRDLNEIFRSELE